MFDASHSPVHTASRSLDVVFFGSGFAMASWGSRIPRIAEDARLGPGLVGAALLAMALAMVASTVAAPHLVRRILPARAIQTGAGLITVALASLVLEPPAVPLVLALLVVGVGTGICDLAMNVAGTKVDLADGGSRMPRLHGMFSLGTVGGATGGTVAAWAGLSARVQVPVSALAFGAVMAVAGYHLSRALPQLPSRPRSPESPRRAGFWGEWTNRRTLAIGIVLLGMAFAEGAANDWLALFLVQGYQQPHALGAAGLLVFVAAMTVTRFAFSALAARPQPHRRPFRRRYDLLLATSGVVVVAGTLLLLLATVIAAHSTTFAVLVGVLGIAVWGAGAALPFPLAVTAAADVDGEAHEAGRPPPSATEVGGPDQDRAVASVSVVTAMGYGAALGGPPLIGWVAHTVNYVSALLLVPLIVVLTLLVAAICHPRPWESRTGLDPDADPGPLPSRGRPPGGPVAGAHGHLSLEPGVNVPE